MLKIVFLIDNSGPFHKTFWHNLFWYWHIALSFDSGYTAKGVNYAEHSFIKLTTVANFIKLFWHNLCCFWYFALNFDSGYAEDSFMTLAPGWHWRRRRARGGKFGDMVDNRSSIGLKKHLGVSFIWSADTIHITL